MGILKTRVIPNSSKNQIIQEKDYIKIKLTSSAKGGKANKQLIEFLSKKLKVPKRKIKIVSGEHSRDKHILIEELSEEEIFAKLF